MIKMNSNLKMYLIIKQVINYLFITQIFINLWINLNLN
jgi:hypothetical protein